MIVMSSQDNLLCIRNAIVVKARISNVEQGMSNFEEMITGTRESKFSLLTSTFEIPCSIFVICLSSYWHLRSRGCLGWRFFLHLKAGSEGGVGRLFPAFQQRPNTPSNCPEDNPKSNPRKIRNLQLIRAADNRGDASAGDDAENE